MKLIVATIRDEQCDKVLRTLIEEEFRVTRIASTGGFLRRGMTTLMIGLEQEDVERAVQIVGDNCDPSSQSGMRTSTLFVLNVEEFIQV